MRNFVDAVKVDRFFLESFSKVSRPAFAWRTSTSIVREIVHRMKCGHAREKRMTYRGRILLEVFNRRLNNLIEILNHVLHSSLLHQGIKRTRLPTDRFEVFLAPITDTTSIAQQRRHIPAEPRKSVTYTTAKIRSLEIQNP